MNQVVKDIAEKRVPLNYAQFIMIIFFIMSTTYTLTNIYAEFRLMKEQIVVLDNKIKTVDIRVTKITKRNADAINNLNKK